MASIESHHGTRVFQSAEEAVIVRFRNTSTGGMVIPIAEADLPAGYTFDKPFVVLKASDAARLPDEVKEEIDSFYDQTLNAIVISLVKKGATAAETTAAMVGDFSRKTGVHSLLKATSLGLPRPKLLSMAGHATVAAPDGVASVAVTVQGSGYSADTTITVAGATGQGAVLTPVIGDDGAVTAVAVAKPGWGYTGDLVFTVNDPGGKGTGATFTGTIGQTLNPILAEMIGVAEKLRAMIYTDGPDSTNEAAVQARRMIGSRRVAYCDPRALKSIDGISYPRPSSTIFAGLQARMDKEQGPHNAGSNMVINGITGMNRPIEYGTEANYLNFNQVNTIINRADIDGAGGFRAWGGWTCSDNALWQFTSVVRVADLVNESIEEALLEFVDRPQTPALLDLMVMSGRNTLRRLENEGVLLSGSAFWIPAGQTADDGVQGILKFGMKYEPPAPIVDLRVTAYRNYTLAYDLLYNSTSGVVEITEAS